MTLIDKIENSRQDASAEVEMHKQKLFEQYFTPVDIVNYMCSLFTMEEKDIKILDAGAGVGNLGSITAIKYLENKNNVTLNSVEWDINLEPRLKQNLKDVEEEYKHFAYEVFNDNFYNFAKDKLAKNKKYNRIIINPPYSLTSRGTDEEIQILKELEVSTPNAYSNFIELCCRFLDVDGELVAIIPRSFCNGTRFTKFRISMLEMVNIEFIHLFESRKKVFEEYGIFQEVIIIKLTKKDLDDKINICISDNLNAIKYESFTNDKVVFNNDPYKFIHIPSKDADERILERIYKLPSNLKELGLKISTGKVVEYRDPHLIEKQEKDSSFMIYQKHIKDRKLDLSIEIKSRPYLKRVDASIHKMLPAGEYIVMKRMSYKENRHRIQSAILTKDDFKDKCISIENHLNYIHKDNAGIEKNLAIGLNAFLISDTLDEYIRRFSGHTQINASDIISLPMPDYDTLSKLGKLIITKNIKETEIEQFLFKEK